jgi:hypothetical protein
MFRVPLASALGLHAIHGSVALSVVSVRLWPPITTSGRVSCGRRRFAGVVVVPDVHVGGDESGGEGPGGVGSKDDGCRPASLFQPDGVADRVRALSGVNGEAPGRRVVDQDDHPARSFVCLFIPRGSICPVLRCGA